MNNQTIVNIICGVLLVGLIGVLLFCLLRKDKFNNKNEMKNSKQNKIEKSLKENEKHYQKSDEKQNSNEIEEMGEIIFLDNPHCGFSQKMKKQLEEHDMKIGNNKVVIKNIMAEGSNLANEYNIKGTPALINEKTKQVVMGFMSHAELEDKFNDNSHSNNNSNSQEDNDKPINVIVGRDNCPFCIKMYNFLKQHNIPYQKISSSSDEGQKLMEQTGASGVPLCLKMLNGKIIDKNIGYTENKDFFV